MKVKIPLKIVISKRFSAGKLFIPDKMEMKRVTNVPQVTPKTLEEGAHEPSVSAPKVVVLNLPKAEAL